jgi:hypothetical protein
MAREYHPDDLATRSFVITMAGVGAFIVAAFLFVILR